ncbi:MAG: cyclomaltodextrin glucanotransferase, partial [Gammaproteobacteria bacterium]|nr:cyclomaltodextrin glucanotransferase [Gammaproteobacteria bacterium]
GKTGYHGYWGVNFYRLDEHLVSPDLDFAGLTSGLDQHGLQTVLDIVCNHGSPSFSMPQDQPLFAELYDAQGNLVADHQNLAPENLDPDNPLHQFFHREPDIAQLSNIDDRNPAALDYFAGAYLQWVEQGADAFRVDTIKHMPHQFWQQFATRIRAEHPGFFMFGESFEYNPQKVAEHTWVENGNISVLDFPGQAAANKVFGEGAGFEELAAQLYLDDGLYHNPYELMTFYDNHDMPRMDADETGFIDANNWLFTSRGIPVIYYGSEVAFRAGRPEHGGNRDYFGQDNVDLARDHIIRHRLARIGKLRQQSPALQRGLQVNLELRGDTAAFYRVYRHEGVAQTALVLLNNGDKPHDFVIERWLGEGNWSDAFGGERVTPSAGTLRLSVPPHDVRVLLREGIAADTELHAELQRLHANRERRRDR